VLLLFYTLIKENEWFKKHKAGGKGSITLYDSDKKDEYAKEGEDELP
jgi:hypothetical protein